MFSSFKTFLLLTVMLLALPWQIDVTSIKINIPFRLNYNTSATYANGFFRIEIIYGNVKFWCSNYRTYQVLLIKENNSVPLKDPASYFESNQQNDTALQREVFISSNLTKKDLEADDTFIIGMFLYNGNFFHICHKILCLKS